MHKMKSKFMTLPEILRIAEDHGKFRKNKYRFSSSQLEKFVNEVLFFIIDHETTIFHDILEERNSEIKFLKLQLEPERE